MRTTINVGSRASKLALWQTRYIVEKLKVVAPEFEYNILTFNTKGDQILNKSLSKIGDKGLFTEALEEAMRKHEIDFAVHSLKDIPTTLPEGLCLSGYGERHDPSDAFLSKKANVIEELPYAAVVGTSSLRRSAQIRRKRPDIIIRDLRGNIQTRLEKYHQGDYDAIILATAGLERLNLMNEITTRLSPLEFLPAVGQGIIAIESRIDDIFINELMEKITDVNSKKAALCERAFLRHLNGGCQSPIGAYATVDHQSILLRAFISSLDGKDFIEVEESSSIGDAELLGENLAKKLLNLGAQKFLQKYGV